MFKSYAAASLISFVSFVVLDFIWLSYATKIVYRPNIGNLLLEKPIFSAAIAFYLLYAIGLSLLVIRPAMTSESVITAIWMGAVFGLITYGTYDLTNLATLKGWSLSVTLIDMFWGATLTAISSGFGVWIVLKFHS